MMIKIAEAVPKKKRLNKRVAVNPMTMVSIFLLVAIMMVVSHMAISPAATLGWCRWAPNFVISVNTLYSPFQLWSLVERMMKKLALVESITS